MTRAGGAPSGGVALDLDRLRADAATCKACPLYADATQTVFGEGRAGASVLFVGEQPGDHEDRDGRPFVGPAGRMLDGALAEVGISREDVYVTNAVKHFKWQPRGKRRIHQKPNAEEIAACKPWLEAELAAVRPRIVVCLGATAAQALLGRSFKVTHRRGEFVDWEHEPLVLATVHPSSILRAAERRDAERARFVDDLRVVATALASPR